MVLAAGDMLTDNLELERELGHGGMGAVWLARNVGLGSKVAVKVLKRLETAPELEQRTRFEQEARGLAQLDHPNLVKIWDFGITLDGDPFIVMELLNGEDLAQRLKRVGPMSPLELAPILQQVCRALAHIHAVGIVHRDIKPANLFLLETDGETTVKLVDFGVAKFAADNLEMTKTGTVLGTPYYMSPEQLLRPRSIDGQSDLWSLGVVAYVALTGKLPFDGETLTAVGMAVAAAEYTTPSALAPKLPASIDAWMKQALAKDPTSRFSSPRQFAQAFEQAASGPSASGPPADSSASGPPRSFASTAAFAPTAPVAPVVTAVAAGSARRRTALLTTAALLVLGGGVAAAGWAWSHSDSKPPELQTPSVSNANPGSATAAAQLPLLEQPTSASVSATSASVSAAVTTTASASASASVVRSTAAHVASGPTTPSAASSASPSSRGTSAPSGLVQSCWRDNEGAEPGTPATTLKVAITVTPAGRATAVRIDGPGRSNKGVVACSVQRLTAHAYGPGADEVLSFAVSLPASKPKSGP